MYIPYTTPFDHQLKNWEASRELEAYAAFWEQGTGKSKFTIDTIGYLWDANEIDAAIMVAPPGVHRNWVTDELPTHMSPEIPLHSFAFKSDASSTKWHQRAVEDAIKARGLSFLAISYDAWMTDRGKKAVWNMMRKRRCFLGLDESHRIKSPDANRTRSILAGGKHAAYRRILSGTPVTQGPLDMYTQIKFLDPLFWRRELDMDSYTSFKSFFAICDKQWNHHTKKEVDIVVGYQNIDVMAEVIKKISSRVTKESAGLNLPDKLYAKRYYEMTPMQKRIYNELDEEYMAILDSGETVSTQLVITKLLRMQQVLCGYVPVDGDKEPTELIERGSNPRLKLLRETMEDVNGKAIIWSSWTRDIDFIMDALRDMGRKPVRYDGSLSEDERARSKDAFKHGDATDFVANSQMSEGLTLNEAKTTIYYNNSYKLLDRQQTEDRNHRIGQTNHVTYFDLVCPGTRDEAVINALVKKSEIAAQILGDNVKAWL